MLLWFSATARMPHGTRRSWLVAHFKALVRRWRDPVPHLRETNGDSARRRAANEATLASLLKDCDSVLPADLRRKD